MEPEAPPDHVLQGPPGRYRGLLLDFYGVLTSSLFEALRAFCRQAGLPADSLGELLTRDPGGLALLVDVERGTIGQAELGEAVGPRLGIDGRGLVERISDHLRPEPQ